MIPKTEINDYLKQYFYIFVASLGIYFFQTQFTFESFNIIIMFYIILIVS